MKVYGNFFGSPIWECFKSSQQNGDWFLWCPTGYRSWKIWESFLHTGTTYERMWSLAMTRSSKNTRTRWQSSRNILVKASYAFICIYSHAHVTHTHTHNILPFSFCMHENFFQCKQFPQFACDITQNWSAVPSCRSMNIFLSSVIHAEFLSSSNFYTQLTVCCHIQCNVKLAWLHML